MRDELAKIEDVRAVFTGVFVRFGEKRGYKGPEPTILLKDVRDESGKVVTDHLWFNLTKGFAALNLKGGETVEFRARVKWYVKGYKGHVWEREIDAPLEDDYKLSHPTKICIIAGRASLSSHGLKAGDFPLRPLRSPELKSILKENGWVAASTTHD